MKRILMVLAVAVVLVLPSTAFAGSTCNAYHPTTCTTVQGTTEAAETTTPVATTEGETTLPFTGLDVALLVAGGVSLLGAGLVVRRLSRQS